jgi:epoxyqueuosine reductase
VRREEKKQIRHGIAAEARRLGFEAASFVSATKLPTERAYQEWLCEGRHGSMDYLEKYGPLRVDPAKMEPGTKSVVVLLTNYHQPLDLLEGGLRIARYAHGDDYHDEIWDRMRELAAFIHAETGAEVATRPAVDTAPLLERDLARVAGLGWVGKNAMLIRQGLGSYTFISEILIGVDLGEEVEDAPQRCGTCTRCLDACPTGAIVAPRVIDARRCISFLTIELRGPIPRRLRPLIGDHLFGCDVCQEVCPWNRDAPVSEEPSHQTRPVYRSLQPIDLLEFDHDRYVEVFRKSAMKRAKLPGLKRNAAVVVGNTGSEEDVERLLESLYTEEEPLVRGHVAWAIGRLGTKAHREWLEAALAHEEEPFVRDELTWAMGELTAR